MTPSHYETIEEYKVSKHLFVKFLGTPSLSEGLGTMLMSNIVTWFKNNVETHEKNLLLRTQASVTFR